MEKCLEGLIACEPSSEDDPAFKVVIVYQDFQCGLRAMQLYERLTKQFATDARFQLDLWKSDILGLPTIADSSSDAAVAADLVIFSLTGGSEVPSRLKNWIEKWVDRKSHEAALVALLGQAVLTADEPSSARDYLCNVAKRGRMKFIADSSEEPQDLTTPLISTAREPAVRQGAFLDQMTYQRNAYAHWGLNE